MGEAPPFQDEIAELEVYLLGRQTSVLGLPKPESLKVHNCFTTA